MLKTCALCEEQNVTNTQVPCESCSRESCCSQHHFCFGCEKIICNTCSDDYSHYSYEFTDGRHGMEKA